MTDVTGSVTTGQTSQQFNTNEEGKTTPRKFTVDKDARSMESGGTYPNYWSHKTRSGHNFIMDDSEGNETITIQHRSGSAIQMKPDGGMLMTTHNGKYEVVFGEERVTISGASDITVKGDTSLRCYGDYNVTVHKDYNLTVLGNMNMTAKNLNRHIRGTMDTEAKTVNKRVEGPITVGTQDSYALTSKNNITNVAGGAGQYAFGGDLAIRNGISQSKTSAKLIVENQAKKGQTYHSSPGTVNVAWGTGQGGLGGHKYGISVGSFIPMLGMIINNQNVQRTVSGIFNEKVMQDHNQTIGSNKTVQVEGTSSESVVTGNKIISVQTGSISQVATAGSVEMRAPAGTANFVGGSTNISSLSGLLGMAGTAGVALDSLGSLLNLNGGIASIASALGLTIPNISTPSLPGQVPQVQGNSANQPQEEPDATGEISSWQ